MNKGIVLFGGVLGLLLYWNRSVLKDLIKQFEGYSDVPYLDAAGFWTIGYGHRIVPGDPYHPYGPVQKIDQAEADVLLNQDMKEARQAVDSFVTVPINQKQRDALTDFTYNLGASSFHGSTLLKLLNAGDYNGAADEFPKWNHAGGKVLAGLTARREAEQQLFLS